MPIQLIRLKIRKIQTERQALVIRSRLLKIPEISYVHIDISNSSLYLKCNWNNDIQTIIKNSLLKMGYNVIN